MPDLRSIVQDLYGRPPAEFVPARADAQKAARASGDDELAARVGRLRKPSVDAWIVDQLPRTRADLMTDVTDLGERLRTASTGGADAAAIRALDAERRALVPRVRAEARAIADEHGMTVTAAVVDKVEDTVRASLVDADAAQAVRDGLLVRGLSPAGFGSVELGDSLAVPELHVPVAPPEDDTPAAPATLDERRVRRARAGLERAAQALVAAEQALDTARGRTAAVERAEEETARRVSELRERLAAEERALRDCGDRRSEAERAESAATEDVDAARRSHEEAEEELRRSESR